MSGRLTLAWIALTAAGLVAGPALSPLRAQDLQQIPQTDIYVEVVARLPFTEKFQSLSLLLSERQKRASFNHSYLPTTLEFIRLVKPNPEQPRGRRWDSIGAVTIGTMAEGKIVVVEYCVDFCDFDRRTGAFNPRRKMVSYRATAAEVEKRLDKKLRELQKYAPR